MIFGLSPAAFAHFVSTSDQPIRVKSAQVETHGHQVIGEVEVCNSVAEPVRFRLKVHNETINHVYYRNLVLSEAGCETFDLDFQRDFAEMSNVGDLITLKAISVRGLGSHIRYRPSWEYSTVVTEGDYVTKTCSDQSGDDGFFPTCEYAFITHEPSGLRIKVKSDHGNYLDLMVTHVEWGGTKEFRLYEGRSKKLRSNFYELERVEITNAVGDGTSDVLIGVETQ